MAYYSNTPETAARIGWNLVPEYCEGDPKAEYVYHDTARGVFIFTNDGPAEIGGQLAALLPEFTLRKETNGWVTVIDRTGHTIVSRSAQYEAMKAAIEYVSGKLSGLTFEYLNETSLTPYEILLRAEDGLRAMEERFGEGVTTLQDQVDGFIDAQIEYEQG